MGYKAFYGETDLNTGLLRLQSLADSKKSSAIIIGSSLTAKLNSDSIFAEFNGKPINLGIDGTVPIFGSRKVIESATKPKLILIETNFLGKQTNSNVITLDDVTHSIRFRAAQFIPVLRQEYRPVTLFYSKLKSMKDDLSSSKDNEKGNSTIKIPSLFIPNSIYIAPTEKERKSILNALSPIEKEWESILRKLKKNSTQVVFVMLPDAKHPRKPSYVFTKYMATKYNIPFIDLKSQLKNENLVYSDGIHLVKKSAIKVSKILNQVLIKNGFIVSTISKNYAL